MVDDACALASAVLTAPRQEPSHKRGRDTLRISLRQEQSLARGCRSCLQHFNIKT